MLTLKEWDAIVDELEPQVMPEIKVEEIEYD